MAGDLRHDGHDLHSKQSLLRMFLKPSPKARPSGSGSQRREPTSLVHFITRTPINVAVGKPESSQLGDICDKEAERMAATPTHGGRLLPHLGLERHEGPVDLTAFDNDNQNSKDKNPTGMPSLEETAQCRSRSPSRKNQSLFQGMVNLFSPTKGPWWKSLLSSPARRFAKTQESLNAELTCQEAPFDLPELAPTRSHRVWKGARAVAPTRGRKKEVLKVRKDLPKTKTHGVGSSKPTLNKAIAVMKSKQAMKAAMESVENDYFANSSRVARSAKRHAVKTILEAAYTSAMPLTPEKLQALAGALRSSGYKSAHTYLAEAKMYHVERGWDWSPLLDRHFKLCTKAVKRGAGPPKKAAEVPETSWKAQPLLPICEAGEGKVKLAAQLFACGVHWMMREIEIAALTSKNVTFDDRDRLVTLTWHESKMDQEGLTVSRTLQCLCEGACDITCPYSVLEVLVNHACLQGNEGAYLSVTYEGQIASKAQIVADWRRLFGSAVSGHSTRRSGALQYIRNGWSVSQVAFLGRWKSSVILEYAKEALQSIPLNADKKLFGTLGDGANHEEVNEVQVKAPTTRPISNLELVGKLRTEIESLVEGSKNKVNDLDLKVKSLESKFDNYTKCLPDYVRSTRTAVVHRNCKVFICAPAYLWRTTCGWNYYNSDYEFVNGEGTMVTCQKCLTSALAQ